MRNLKFTVSYDGTLYYGFQTQPDGNTIQDKLEEAVLALTGETVKITSSGRTDAGVHARAQVINFTTASAIPVERWCMSLNSRLPRDIVVLSAEEAPLSFHSRRSAKKKMYGYTIRSTRLPSVFNRFYEMHHPGKLNVEAMKEGLAFFVGEHDFSSFCSIKTKKTSHVRTIYRAWLDFEPDVNGDESRGVIRIYIEGNGFLHNMVRIIVGTLLWVGEGKIDVHRIPEAIAARNRAYAGPTAEAQGLTLWHVTY
jgi:tRNA pseudouridine38-40 synthase